MTALLTLDANGRCSQVAVTLFGVGGVPVRIDTASALLVGYVPDDDRIAAVAQTVPGQVEPESGIHASADFRRHLSEMLTRRALQQAIERAAS